MQWLIYLLPVCLLLAIQPTNVTLEIITMSLVVSWTAPKFIISESYSVSLMCLRLCDQNLYVLITHSVPNELTSHNFTSIIFNSGYACTVRVTAFLGSISSESDEVTTNIITEGV